MVKKKKTKTAGPDPLETTVELHLPTKLYAKAQTLYGNEPELFSEVVRAVFARDQLFGITTVKLVKGVAISKVGKSKDPYKTCDVGPMP
jgi:hypothetical protein